MKKIVAFWICCVLVLSSCAGVRKVRDFYKDGQPKPELPALIIASEKYSVLTHAGIKAVDDMRVTLFNSSAGSSLAARVPPGKHLVEIEYLIDPRSNHQGGLILSKALIKNIPLDAKPGHVYIARYKLYKSNPDQKYSDEVSVFFEDVGFDKDRVFEKYIDYK